jgi:hypothetical protein
MKLFPLVLVMKVSGRYFLIRPGILHSKIILIAIFSFPLVSCSNLMTNYGHGTVLCPESVALRAEDYARRYSAVETQYIWGAQDRFDAREVVRIDCSGLVVNCYSSAVDGSGYGIPFVDASVADFYDRYSLPVTRPRAGDIIFMGSRYQKPTHMAIFVDQDREYIYFIDATFLPEEGVNGVSLRSYAKNDPRLRSFGRVLLQHY